MKTEAEDNGDGDAGKQVWIRRRRRCGTETDEMWDDRDGEMGWKDGFVLGKHLQVMNTNLRDYCCSGIMGMADKFSGEDSIGRARWRRCGTATE